MNCSVMHHKNMGADDASINKRYNTSGLDRPLTFLDCKPLQLN